MKKLLFILMLGSLFADSVTYENYILMFKRTKTLENIKFEGFVQILGEKNAKFLISEGVLGKKHMYLTCEKLIEIRDDDGNIIDNDCFSTNKLISSGNNLVEFRKQYYNFYNLSLTLI